jgi:CMP/dCMP kinase
VIVAIDGPAGAGKSTVARAVAEALGFAHMDTGAMYRALTVAALDGADLDDPAQLEEVVGGLDMSLEDSSVTLNGVDVTGRLRETNVTDLVSAIAARPHVRVALVPFQKRLADDHDVVVEGRDIGTVVFPHAEVKVYLTASPEERALRRARQVGTIEETSVTELEAVMRSRDSADATRETSPLQEAAGATRIDSTGVPFAEVVERVVELVRAAADGR